MNTLGTTCTISCSSSLKYPCLCRISFQLRQRISFMGKLTGSKIPFRHPMLSKKETWPISRQPLRPTSQPNLRSLRRSCWGHPTRLKKSLPTKHSSNNFVTSSPGPTLKFLGWIHPLLSTTSTHGLIWSPYAKSNGQSIPPKLPQLKPKLRSCT